MAPNGKVISTGNDVDGKELSYPPPLATHAAVVNDPSVFSNTLQMFYHAIGTKFVVPKIDKKCLDLHMLYVEVTKRGGYEEVVAARNWNSVSSMFMFAPRRTNVSYTLKKHYFRFLYHYEQVYFKVLDNGEPSTINNNSPGNNEILIPTGNDERNMLPDTDESNILAGNDGSIILNCVIEAKLDIGNVISVEMDNEVFYAIVPHPSNSTIASTVSQTMPYAQPTNADSNFAATTIVGAPPTNVASNNSAKSPSDNATTSELPTKASNLYPTTQVIQVDITDTSEPTAGALNTSESNTEALNTIEPSTKALKSRRKRSRADPNRPKNHTETEALNTAEPHTEALNTSEPRMKALKSGRKTSQGDPNRPKNPRSGYTFFFSMIHPKIRSAHPKTSRQNITRRIGRAWRSLTDQEKLSYQEMAMVDKERYIKEKEEYQKKKKNKIKI